MLRNLRDLAMVLAMLGGLMAVIAQGKEITNIPPEPALYTINIAAYGEAGKEQYKVETEIPSRLKFEPGDRERALVKAGDHLVEAYYQPLTAKLAPPAGQRPKFTLQYDITVRVSTDPNGKPHYDYWAHQFGAKENTPPLEPAELVRVGQYLIDRNAEPKPAVPKAEPVYAAKPEPGTFYLFRCSSSPRLDMMQGADEIVHWRNTDPRFARYTGRYKFKVIDIQARNDAGAIGGISEEFAPWKAAGIPSYCNSVLVTDSKGRVEYWRAAPDLPRSLDKLRDELAHRFGSDMQFKFRK